MAQPSPIPLGLAILESTTHLFIMQCIEVTEALSGFETKNKYEIVNSKMERVYFAVEVTNDCLVCCSKTSRPFKFNVVDNVGKVVMRIERPCACMSCCGCRLCCCGLLNSSKVNVTLPDGERIGQVEESCTIFTPRFIVRDENLDKQIRIQGPKWAFCCNCKLTGNVEFQLHSLGGTASSEPCGRISKEFEGLERRRRAPGEGELRSDADNYGISFPIDMAPALKATLLGAVLLIDFEYFEDDAGGKV